MCLANCVGSFKWMSTTVLSDLSTDGLLFNSVVMERAGFSSVVFLDTTQDIVELSRHTCAFMVRSCGQTSCAHPSFNLDWPRGLSASESQATHVRVFSTKETHDHIDALVGWINETGICRECRRDIRSTETNSRCKQALARPFPLDCPRSNLSTRRRRTSPCGCRRCTS